MAVQDDAAPLSNELVAEARENGCSVIAFEDLTDIRERTGASWGLKWAFNLLYEYVEYKAEEHDIVVEQETLRTHRGDVHTVASRTQTIAMARNSSA